jgi:hypothetical protein
MMRRHALQDLFTLPPILAAVLSRHGVHFAVRIDGAGARAWRFEFERRALLRVEPGGAWAWLTGAEATRLSLEPVILAAAHATAEAQRAFESLAEHGDDIPASSFELSPSQLEASCDGGCLFLESRRLRVRPSEI